MVRSDDEGVRAALEAEREACAKIADAAGLAARASVDRQDAKTAGGTALLTGYTFAATEAESIARAIRSRAALSTPVPVISIGDETEAEDDAEGAWCNLALQFDGHRIEALSWLKAMVADPVAHREGAEAFLAAPPISGEKVLAKRIAGLPRGSASAAEGEPVAWFYEFLGHNDQWIADVRLAKPKAPSGGAIRNVRPLSFAEALAAAEARADRVEEALRNALRGIEVAQLGLNRNGVQHAKLKQVEATLRTILKETPHGER